MADATPNKFLDKMLDRLFAAMVSGPSLNCRPHASRQRLDFTQLAKLQDLSPDDALRRLLGDARRAKLAARVPVPPRRRDVDVDAADTSDQPEPTNGDGDTAFPAEQDEAAAARRRAERAWADQAAVLNKLRVIADDARTYEQDTGVHVLNIGFPLVSLPAGSFGSAGRQGHASRRVLAPLAFIPVTLTVKRGPTQSVELECYGEGVDLVTPNEALLAWVEQQTGKSADDLFADEHGQDPWRELCDVTRRVAGLLELDVPEIFRESAPPPADPGAAPESIGATPGSPSTAEQEPQGDTGVAPTNGDGPPPTSDAVSPLDHLALQPAPRADDLDDRPVILVSAVLGLFPMANQGLLRDMQALAAGDQPLAGPVESFVRVGVSLDAFADVPEDEPVVYSPRAVKDERFVSAADPCQSRAVRLSRTTKGLVIHGPPGTGKSQTITNIIGDHLARGQRVLLVCDKRTALDVVANRLDHLGLGQLCALVHDPQRDQRELYRAIREQLDALTESESKPGAEKKLEKIDAELQSLHDELTGYYKSLMTPPTKDESSFHDLVGQWLGVSTQLAKTPLPPDLDTQSDTGPLAAVRLPDLDAHEQVLREILTRADAASYADNPWVAATAGGSLAEFLARPMDQVRRAMADARAAGQAADAVAHESIPPFAPHPDLAQEAQARAALAEPLQRVLSQVNSRTLQQWSKVPAADIARARQRLRELDALVQTFRAGPLDAELALSTHGGAGAGAGTGPTVAQIAVHLSALARYLEIADKWHAVFQFGIKSHAARVLNPYGLPLSRDNAQRLHRFLTGLRARLVLQAFYHETLTRTPPQGRVADDVLDKALHDHAALFELLTRVDESPALKALDPLVRAAMTDSARAAGLLDGLRRSPARVHALIQLDQKLAACKLFAKPWTDDTSARLRQGGLVADELATLESRLDILEGVLRVQAGLASLPADLRPALELLVRRSVGPEPAWLALRRAALAGHVRQRLAADPHLQGTDGQRLRTLFDRYRQLDADKKKVVRDAILHRWTDRQRERLLAATGSRLNSQGADLRRRLTLRGERATRLRQVVKIGQSIDGGDPLFDLRPAWLASPETVAQVFPRQPMFDVVVFDEASQCRLEEALPVLLRGQRVVVAGDPKQLPPTRFFESTIAQSDDTDEPETDQDLFEAQQSEVEDLLGAALNLEIEQSYLDVHYRSRNADLIAFSNEHFYGSRLQAIPGHPSNRTRFAPLRLYAVNGTYEKRQNPAEANQVCAIVRDLLKRAKPPSIGIACFNLTQRDLTVEKLDELAEEDPAFGKRLADARTRTGAGSFEGLFVKNLENVQGDERDHIIISTTYGPDPGGRFYRRFGPLARAGGGRRLNVLVTRAREEIHLVTSIPPEAYRHLPAVPADQKPGGGWLLFAYLATAERIIADYAETGADVTTSAVAPDTPPPPAVRTRPTRTPSPFAEALAALLADGHQTASDVYWGNDGFCVDLALRHPARPDDVTVGLLCDATRFHRAYDPVEWDLFRTAVHESQGWQLHRLWTPHFFRDPEGTVAALLKQARAAVGDTPPDALRTTPAPRDRG